MPSVYCTHHVDFELRICPTLIFAVLALERPQICNDTKKRSYSMMRAIKCCIPYLHIYFQHGKILKFTFVKIKMAVDIRITAELLVAENATIDRFSVDVSGLTNRRSINTGLNNCKSVKERKQVGSQFWEGFVEFSRIREAFDCTLR